MRIKEEILKDASWGRFIGADATPKLLKCLLEAILDVRDILQNIREEQRP